MPGIMRPFLLEFVETTYVYLTWLLEGLIKAFGALNFEVLVLRIYVSIL